MVERNDPGRAGVKAGRVVGLLTAALTVVVLLGYRGPFYEGVVTLLDRIGTDVGVPVGLLFWLNVGLVASGRYVFSYIVGSLVGVLYDALDRPSIWVVVVIVLLIGVADGIYAGLSAQSVLVGVAFVAAWLCYVPVFVWLFDADAPERSGPRRLNEL